MNIKILSLLTLLHTPGLGRVKIWKLIEHFGSPSKVLEAGLNRDKSLLFDQWKLSLAYENDLEIAEKEGVQLITYQDPKYPKNLLNIPDFPLLLYVKGELAPRDFAQLAMIGTRNATLYGKQQAEQIAKEVAQSGMIVVSGLARGIDTSTHTGALEGGKTYAIIGSGLSQIYPKENRYLADKIAESGAIISEFPMKMAPTKGLFPRRNRVISGISDGVFLVESPLKGGGMLTMQLAQKHQKPLFALPGRVDWPTFSGNHFLIKEKKAQLVENSDDLLKHFPIIKNKQVKKVNSPLLSPKERAFLASIPCEEKTIEELVLLTQLPIMQLNVFLTRLVLKKVVKEFPGKIYKKISNG